MSETNGRPDLSQTFGTAAASSLEGLLPRRGSAASAAGAPGNGAGPVPDDAEPDAGETASEAGETSSEAAETSPDAGGSAPDDEETAPDPSSPPPPSRRRGRPAGTAGVRPSVGHRWGRLRVTSPDHVDLLVLCALLEGAADGRSVIERIGRDSDGALTAPTQTVYRALHRLTRRKLLRSGPGSSGRPHYELTTAGRSTTDARRRQWESYTRAVGAVVRAAGP